MIDPHVDKFCALIALAAIATGVFLTLIRLW
jgi:hypothetical protein